MSLQNGCFDKAYFEITNVCNAACRFCPGTKRKKHFVSDNEFDTVLSALRGRVKHLYFHLMGEPMLHPSVCDFARRAADQGFRVMITSNGILAGTVGRSLIETDAVHKISLSLHSYEANAFGVSLENYLSDCFDLAEYAADLGTVCVLKLWNRGGEESLNPMLLAAMRARFGDDWRELRSGFCLKDYVFLEWGDYFEWPQAGKEGGEDQFCYGLRNQIGILSDGSGVPCCLDSEGRMVLGNLYRQSLDDVLRSPRAKAIYDGFSAHKATEELCRCCGYVSRFR